MSFKTLHKLTRRRKMLKDFYVLDLETGTVNPDGSIQWKLDARPESFVFGVIYGFNFQKIIYSRNEFLTELKDPRYKGKKIFAHNGGKYDYICLFDKIFNVDPHALFIGSRFICMRYGESLFGDSLNIFTNTSIEKIGEQLGIKKPELGNKNYWSPSLGPNEINRCIVDCQILWDALFLIFDFAGDIKITQAGLSLSYYRREHQPFHIDFNDNVKYFWESYFGGRCESFVPPGTKTFSSLIDVNSMYPWVMKSAVFPNPKFLKYLPICSVKKLTENLFKYYEGCVECTVKHKEFWFGFLPVKIDGKTVFPTGTFTGCWNFNEIKFAYDQGIIEILSVKKVVYSEPMKSPFISYVDFLYNQRFATDSEFEKYRLKIFMNSLYGKFGQRIVLESVYIQDVERQIDEIQDYQKSGRFVELSMFNQTRKDAILTLKSTNKKALYNSIPSFASYVTSGGRVILAKKLLELQGRKPTYCDTDSIAYEVDYGDFSYNDIRLGEWKKELKIITKINGLKNYRYKKIKKVKTIIGEITYINLQAYRKLKGIPEKRAKEIAENVYEYNTLTGAKEALRRNVDAGVMTKRQKTISNKYEKRIIDGEKTKPISL